MLDYALLSPQALSYYNALPLSARIAMEHSNLTLRTLEDLKSYVENSVGQTDPVLYQTLPDPAIPSNSALDPLDAQ